MGNHLSVEINGIMEREMQDMGLFIVKKQCYIIGADPDNIQPSDLPALAGKLSEVMRTFGGYEKARKIYKEIKKLEDLEGIVEQEESSEAKFKMLEDLGKGSLFAAEWDKAFEYFDQLLREAEKNGDLVAKSRYLRRLGFIHQERAEFDEAFEFNKLALEAAEEANDPHQQADCYNALGTVQWNMGNFPRAIEMYEKAARFADKSENANALGMAEIGLGNVYADMERPNDAVDHYARALKYLEDTENFQQIARAHNNLGDTYLLMKEWDKALESLEKAVEFADTGGWLNMKSWAEVNTAIALINKGELERAKEMLDSSLSFLEKIGDRAGIGAAYQAYGMLNMAKKDWDMAILSIQRAVDTFTEINTPMSLADCRFELGLAYKSKGDKMRAKEEIRRAANLYTHLDLDTMVKKMLKTIEAMD